jgi:hypothetical protein
LTGTIVAWSPDSTSVTLNTIMQYVKNNRYIGGISMEKLLHTYKLGIGIITGLILVLAPLEASSTMQDAVNQTKENSELIHSAVFLMLIVSFTLWTRLRGKRH